MMSFKPLCPPAEPRPRTRSRPGARLTSSQKTMSRAAGSLYQASASPMLSPERFMKVWGFNSSTRRPATTASALSPWKRERSMRTPAFSAMPSSARKPALCRVPS